MHKSHNPQSTTSSPSPPHHHKVAPRSRLATLPTKIQSTTRRRGAQSAIVVVRDRRRARATGVGVVVHVRRERSQLTYAPNVFPYMLAGPTGFLNACAHERARVCVKVNGCAAARAYRAPCGARARTENSLVRASDPSTSRRVLLFAGKTHERALRPSIYWLVLLQLQLLCGVFRGVVSCVVRVRM